MESYNPYYRNENSNFRSHQTQPSQSSRQSLPWEDANIYDTYVDDDGDDEKYLTPTKRSLRQTARYSGFASGRPDWQNGKQNPFESPCTPSRSYSPSKQPLTGYHASGRSMTDFDGIYSTESSPMRKFNDRNGIPQKGSSRKVRRTQNGFDYCGKPPPLFHICIVYI